MSLRPLLQHLADDPNGPALAREGGRAFVSALAAALRHRGAAGRRRRPAGGRPALVVAGDDRQARDLAADLKRGWRRGRFASTRAAASPTSRTSRRRRTSSACASPRSTRCWTPASRRRRRAAGRRRLRRRAQREGPRPRAAPARRSRCASATCSTSTRSRRARQGRLRARRPGRGPRPVRDPRRHPRRLSGDRGARRPRRPVRHRDRVAALVLDLHAALAGRDRPRSRSRPPPSWRPSTASWPRSRRSRGRRRAPRRRRAAAGRPLPRLPGPRARRRAGARSPPRRRSRPALADHWQDVCAAFHDDDAHHLYVKPETISAALDARAARPALLAASRPAASSSAPRPPTSPRARCKRGRARAREARPLAATARSSRGRGAARASAPPTTSRASRPAGSGERGARSSPASCASPSPSLRDGFIAGGPRLAVIPEHRLFRRKRAERTRRPGRRRRGALRSLRRPAHRRARRPRGPRRRALRRLRDQDRRRRHARLPRARVRRHGQGLHAGRPAGEDQPLPRRRRRRARRCRKLGGKSWETMKARARRAAQELAGELLNLYAERKRRAGHGVPRGLRVAARVRGEVPLPGDRRPARGDRGASRPTWSAPQPMDRLICGDVGYGKTEVALRAAFKAADDGKQVLSSRRRRSSPSSTSGRSPSA